MEGEADEYRDVRQEALAMNAQHAEGVRRAAADPATRRGAQGSESPEGTP
jgi:hypothetical protein